MPHTSSRTAGLAELVARARQLQPLLREHAARGSRLIFPVPALIANLSATTPLLPGDVIFTGTPSGVGAGRTPPRWLVPGDELVSRIEGIGELRHRFIAAGR